MAPPRSPVWRARFAPLASALALVVVAATGYLFTHRNGDDRRMTIPAAVVATARPSADDPVVDTLLTIGLPTGKVPSGHGATSGLALFTIPVGARSTWMPTCCAGPMIEYVLQGAYGVRAQAPLTVVRAGGTVEEVAPGLEVSLAAGDALISRNETVVVTWNDGLIPTVLLDWIVIDGGTGHLVPGWRAGPADFRHGVTPPNRGTIRLVRVTLTDGGEIAFDHPGRLQFVVSATGASGDVVRRTDDSIKAIRAGAGVTYVAYVLSVEPDSPATPSASSPAPMPDL